MEMIILTTEMLLTHGVENISRVVRHCNRKFAIQVVTSALTIGNFMFRKRSNELTDSIYEQAYA